MLHKPCVLIVEDEVILSMVLEGILEELDCGICANATNAQQAIELFEELHPDLVLLDIRLQGSMNGIDCARIIRGKSGTVQLVFMTAYGTDEIRKQAEVFSPMEFIEKPVSETALMQILKNLTSISS